MRNTDALNHDLEQLVLLQAIDLEIKHLRAELVEAPKRVARAEAASAQAKAALAAAKAALAKEEVLRRSQESDIQDRKGKIVRLQKQMETATSAAQISALEHEITFSEGVIAELETAELESMERTETSEAAEAAATELVAKTASGLETERARAAETLTRNTAAIATRETERKAARAAIGETPLANYDRVSKGKGTAISEAIDHKCSACQMMVRPQRWNDLTGRDYLETLFVCETCGRTLYWDPRRDAPGAWLPGDRLTAARLAENQAK